MPNTDETQEAVELPNTAAFRAELKERFCVAAEKRWSTLFVRAKHLHNDVCAAHNVNHKDHNRMPDCCRVMWQEKSSEDTVVMTPEQRLGPSLLIEYCIPRPAANSPKDARKPRTSPLPEQDFCALWRQKLLVGTEMDNLSGDNVTAIVSYSETKVKYQRGDSKIEIAFADLYWGYQQIRDAGDAGLTTTQLKQLRPAVFDGAAAHGCNCTFLFQGLEKLGLIEEVGGRGVKGSPFIAFAR